MEERKLITKEEFLNYVKSFNKQPGYYSNDEIIKIGLAHKSIANSADKS